MRSVASLLLLLAVLSANANAAQVDDEDLLATFVGVVDFRRPEPPSLLVASATATGSGGDVGGFNDQGDNDGHKLQPSTADGSKGTHYGDPAEGCMKDEVRGGTCYVASYVLASTSVIYCGARIQQILNF